MDSKNFRNAARAILHSHPSSAIGPEGSIAFGFFFSFFDFGKSQRETRRTATLVDSGAQLKYCSGGGSSVPLSAAELRDVKS